MPSITDPPAQHWNQSECHLCESAANVTVAGATYGLYTHVHKHYGLNDAFDRSVKLLQVQQLATSRESLHVQVSSRI